MDHEDRFYSYLYRCAFFLLNPILCLYHYQSGRVISSQDVRHLESFSHSSKVSRRTSPNMEHNQTSSNFYAGLLEWDSIKILDVVFNFFIILLGPLLLYSVIWYERFSADLMYRTLINQLLSHLCYIQIVSCFLTRIAFFLNYCFSPLPLGVCDVGKFVGRWGFVCMLTQITTRQLIKYLYIFKWKCIVCLEDDFFALFITISNILHSTILVVVAFFLGFHNEEPGKNSLKVYHNY